MKLKKENISPHLVYNNTGDALAPIDKTCRNGNLKSVWMTMLLITFFVFSLATLNT